MTDNKRPTDASRMDYPDPTPITETYLQAYIWTGYWKEWSGHYPDTSAGHEDLRETLEWHKRPGDLFKICRIKRSEIDSLEVPNA